MKKMELFSYADIQKHPGYLVFISLEKERQTGCSMLMTKGNLVKSPFDYELQTNEKITGTCGEKLNYSLFGSRMSVLTEEDILLLPS